MDSEEFFRSDERIEEMLRQAVQELHKKILIEKYYWLKKESVGRMHSSCKYQN